jgi:hypothetical protein
VNYPAEQYLQAAPAPGRVGQGTAVEQSRAVAEVQAAVMVARQFPRIEAYSISRMTEACKQPALAKRAFYSFPKGGSTVAGETIHLAKELARCWGNIQYGLVELRRDDEFAQSEMQAWAWDMESNERVSTTFIVPHARWAQNKAQKLSDFRDIYENNSNNGSRRLREMIFSVLPVWYIEQAKDLCTTTLKHGGGVPLAQRVAQATSAYQARGITTDQLEQNRGRKVADWTDMDLAQLEILYQSLERGEVTPSEAFPEQRVTVAEVTQLKQPAAASEQPGGAE